MTVPEEDGPRILQCKLLEPGEGQDDRPMTLEEIKQIFGTELPKAAGQNPEPEESAESDLSDCFDEENPVLVEAENMIPEIPFNLGEGDWDDLPHQLGDVPEVPHDLVNEDEEYVVEEEIVYEPPSKNSVPEEEPEFSSAASSSKGLNCTPSQARHSIPPTSKIQRKKAAIEGRCNGFQAWPYPGAVSRWFSYGIGGQFETDLAAFQAANIWLWEQVS